MKFYKEITHIKSSGVYYWKLTDEGRSYIYFDHAMYKMEGCGYEGDEMPETSCWLDADAGSDSRLQIWLKGDSMYKFEEVEEEEVFLELL